MEITIFPFQSPLFFLFFLLLVSNNFRVNPGLPVATWYNIQYTISKNVYSPLFSTNVVYHDSKQLTQTHTDIRKEALVQQQIKTLHRDPKVLAKIYGLFYGANLSVYTAALLNCF